MTEDPELPEDDDAQPTPLRGGFRRAPRRGGPRRRARRVRPPLRHVVRPGARSRVPHPVGRRGRGRRRAGRVPVGLAQPRTTRGSAARSAAGCSASRATARSIASARTQRARPVDDERLAVIERVQTRPEDRLGAIDDPGQRRRGPRSRRAALGRRGRARRARSRSARPDAAPRPRAERDRRGHRTQPQRDEPTRAPRATTPRYGRGRARAVARRRTLVFGAARRTDGRGCERLRRGRGAGDGATREDVRRVRRTPPDAPLAGFDVRGRADHQLPRAEGEDRVRTRRGRRSDAGLVGTRRRARNLERHGRTAARVASRSRSSRPRQSSSASSPSARHASTTAHRSR